jgi:HAD superfamily hydrolase (TIGR01484 family)
LRGASVMNKVPRVIFSDFDGTLTLGHDLSREFFEVLDWCHQKKCPLIINTGRSLQWGLFFLTHFSALQYVIVEGGGVVLERLPSGEIKNHQIVCGADFDLLQKTIEQLKIDFPHLKLSDDSYGRMVDRAYERPENREDLEQISKRLASLNIPHLVSNVHLNFWTGDMSKAMAAKWVLANFFPSVSLEQSLFFGDSQNDESMFAEFPWTVGVSNIEKALLTLKAKPSFILKGLENAGIRGVLNYLKSLDS